MKKALFTFITGGVEYVKGQVYTAEQVADLDATNFVDTDETPVVEEVAEVIDSNVASTEVVEEVIDSNKGDEEVVEVLQ